MGEGGKQMKRSFALIAVVFIGLFFVCASVFSEGEKIRDNKEEELNINTQGLQFQAAVPNLNFGKFPLYFIANKGQVNKKAKFYAKASRYTLWLTGEGLVFDSTRQVEEGDTPRPFGPPLSRGETHHAPSGHPSQEGSNRLPHSPYPPKLERDVSRLMFLNTNKNPGIVPLKESRFKVNYFIGSDPSKWRCDIPTSQAVLYKELYKNIDLKVYGIEKQIEYDWMVKPGGNPGDISFEYKNVKNTRLDEEGNLLIETEFGELIHKKPVSYQVAKSRSQEVKKAIKETVDVTFKKIGENTFGFEVGEYDKNCELVIDPVVLVASTSIGGSDQDHGNGIAVDSSGFVYVAGYTQSTNFPTRHPYQQDQPNWDMFVTKLDNSLDPHPYYSTYIGGSSHDVGKSAVMDNNGFLYVTGYTLSTNFPTKDQYQTYPGGATNAFIVKIDTARSGTASLLYSTYLGGSRKDNGYAITVDNSECVYVTGETNSGNLPLRDQYQNFGGYYDAFVTKLDTTKQGGAGLIYSTYLGGGNVDAGYAIAVDDSGHVYVAGYTRSTTFPIRNQYQKDQPYSDAFVTKLDPTQSGASSLIYSTYFGGKEYDEANAIAVDNNGIAYVAGCKCWTSWYLYDCYEIFIIKINTTQSGTASLINSIYMSGHHYGLGITLDSSRNTYVTGWSSKYYDQLGGYLTKLDADFNPIYFTYFEHPCNGVVLDTSGYVYVAGGFTDVFVARLISDPIDLPTVTTAAASSVTETSAACGGNITDDGGVPVTARGVCWSTSKKPTISGNHTTDGNGTGTFTSALTGLTPNTTYYARAYAVNLAGTAYGNEVKFMTAVPIPPHIVLNRTRLNFGAVSGESRTGSQTFLIGNSGGSSLTWTVSPADTWIKASPLNGTGNMMVTVSVDAAGLAPGAYAGMITITDPNADNSPAEVEVYLDVKTKSQELPPFGTFETPLAGSLVYSSIPVTGWMLDDVEVSYVKIYRNPVQGQEKGLIYVGDGVFVEGARPDVEQTYPQYPYNYRAGWGYMMLTNFLPQQGNGTFVITAIAIDSSGNKVTLGEKTIICDNVNAVKPFGAIDTPTQGGDASGAGFINFGWALTPQPNTIPKDGSTIKVWVDGVPLAGNPVYNQYRKDVAALFPGYNNSDGAVGYYYLDTTLYANGVHTIAWSVTDNAGNTDGIGSRYFNIMNVNNPAAASVSGFNSGYSPQDTFSIEQLPTSASPVHLKKGYNVCNHQNPCYPDGDGVITIEIREGERIEIQNTSSDSSYYCGYMVVGHQLKPLPVGSFLDTRCGVFYWQVGVGFIGKYQLVFIEKNKNGEFKRKHLEVIIHSKY
jgi:hypothetical protein